jgi:oxygen-independent coproporphyrinogen-3 oxidase
MKLPPLSLYVHLPWCVRKCPYCDFNSHAAKDELPADEYVEALLTDLEQDLPLVWGRTVHSIFFGGGTPSLFNARQIETLLSGFRGLLPVSPAAEVTLEANPGTTEHDGFSSYRDAGVNRISLGAQTFSDEQLNVLGRIHGRAEIHRAVESIQAAGIDNFNIDLMYALPGQSVNGAVQDVKEAIACAPSHISHYQLTIEPNTAFHVNPPQLPDDEIAWDMQLECAKVMAKATYEQYEISAWARAGYQCRHNLNYWQYGDYIGVGAGAHGKITLPSEQAIRRRVRHKHPLTWMKQVVDGESIIEDRVLGERERIFEFFLNQLRLRDGIRKSQFPARTGMAWSEVSGQVEEALAKGLLNDDGDLLKASELGWRFNNEIQAIFLP